MKHSPVMGNRSAGFPFPAEPRLNLRARPMNRYLVPVTPAEIRRELAALCATLVPGIKPAYVVVRSEEGAPPNECFPIVDATVARRGGSAVFGWSLWEFPEIFVEAEFHAVWVSPTATVST